MPISMAELAQKISLMTILTTAVIVGVHSEPVHVSGPDDIHVFEGESGVLRCIVKNITGYVISWQYIDGDGEGTIIGRCYSCPPADNCTTEIGQEQNYDAGRNVNSYELYIHNISSSIGYYQCGYQALQDCSSSSTVTTGRYNLLQSAITYVYSSPQCNIALLQRNKSEVEYTCTWKPRFSFHAHAPKALVTIGGSNVGPDLLLPGASIKRLTISNGEGRNLKNASCSLVLADGKDNRACSFPTIRNESVSVIIDPLDVDVRIGQTQRMTCYSAELDVERKWIFFSKDDHVEDEVTKSRLSHIAGYVRFPLDSSDAIDLEPRQGARPGRFFIRCLTNASQGSTNSAYASVNVLATTEHSPTSSSKPSHTTSLREDHRTTDASGKGDGGSDLGLFLFIVIPIVLIAIFFVIIFVVVYKRTHQHTYKQQPRIPENPDANYEVIGPCSGVVLTGENRSQSNDVKNNAETDFEV